MDIRDQIHQELIDLRGDLSELKGTFLYFKEQDHLSRIELDKRIKNLSDKLTTIKDELSIYKTTYKVVKFVIGATILLLTLKFGDIKLLFNSIFG